MNKTDGISRARLLSGSGKHAAVLCILISIFLPLPLILLPVLLAISLVVVSRAGPPRPVLLPVRFASPPALRSPPY